MEEIAKILQCLRMYEDVRKDYQKVLRAGNWPVTGPQVGVLRAVARMPDISVSGLAEVMGVHITTAEGYAKRLEEKGMLSLTEDPKDKRRKLLQVTAAGQDLITSVPLGYKSLLVQNLLTAPPEECRAILQGLEKLIFYMKAGDIHAK